MFYETKKRLNTYPAIKEDCQDSEAKQNNQSNEQKSTHHGEVILEEIDQIISKLNESIFNAYYKRDMQVKDMNRGKKTYLSGGKFTGTLSKNLYNSPTEHHK